MATLLDRLVVEVGPRFINQGELRRLERGVDRAKRRLDGFAAGAAKFGAGLTAALTVTGKTVFDFEKAMNQTQATLLATGDQMKELRDQAKDLGATTQFSASQVAEAQNAMAQAGLDVNQILESTPAVLNLAAAGALSMEQAAKLTANQLRAFNLDVDEAGRVTDVLALAAARSNTSVAELGPAFRQVAPLAFAAGLSIEETAGYLGVLRNNGFAAEQAGTAMRAVLARLADAAGPASETLEEVGLDPEKIQQSLEAGKLTEVLETLRTANLDLNQAIKIFGTEAGAAGLVMINGADSAAALSMQFDNAAGSAQQMADIQNQGVVGAIRNLRSAFEGLQIELGEAGVGGAIEWVATKLTDLTLWLKDSDEWVRKLLAGALIAGPGLIAAGVAAKGIAFALGGLVPLLKLARWAMLALNVVMRANPIGLLITALAAVIIYWDEIVEATQWAVDKIGEAWDSLMTWFSSLSLADAGKQLLQTLIGGIVSVKDQVLGAIKDALGPIGKWLPGSDAEEGPLSQLTAAGRAIPQTIARGIQQAPRDIQRALAAGALALPTAVSALPVGPVPPPAAGGGGITLNVTLGESAIVIHAEGGDAGQIAAGIGDALGEEMRALVEQMDSRYRA